MQARLLRASLSPTNLAASLLAPLPRSLENTYFVDTDYLLPIHGWPNKGVEMTKWRAQLQEEEKPACR